MRMEKVNSSFESRDWSLHQLIGKYSELNIKKKKENISWKVKTKPRTKNNKKYNLG